MLRKSESSLQKELDLKKFITRQRLSTYAILSLLKSRQRFQIDRMSQMVVRESSNFEWTSSDEDLSDMNLDSKIFEHARKMATSSNEVDKRLLNIFVMKQAHQEGLKFGFKNEVENMKNNKRFSLHQTSKVNVEKIIKDREIDGGGIE